MPEISQAQEILTTFGMPPAQHNEMAALTLLALCGLRPTDTWDSATRSSLTITKGIMAFIHQQYGKTYAPNTRETFRRQVLHQFVQAGIADYNPDAPTLSTNSPKAHYALSETAWRVIRAYGSDQWEAASSAFRESQAQTVSARQQARARAGIPVRLPGGGELTLSPGQHNDLQVQVIQQFAPRFAPGAALLYLGDTADKDLFIDGDRLSAVGIAVSSHDKLPDIILHDSARNWIFLIEVVTSHGPMTPKRVAELEMMVGKTTIGKIFVTAFPSFAGFRKHLKDIAWDTEVWIADAPDHLIHFNGDRFFGPR